MQLDIKKNVPLAQYTTLHVGGVADYVAEVTAKEEVVAACAFAQEAGIPVLILGGGSNVLINDEGYRGLVILMNIKGRTYTETIEGKVSLWCGAGEVLDEVVEDTTARGLWGLENLSSIPGSVGATPVQNVGAYGVEVSQLISFVETIEILSGKEKIFPNDECNFLYRDSFFKSAEGKDFIITGVTFMLASTPQVQVQYADLKHLKDEEGLTPAQVRREVQQIRAGKFPDWSQIGTAGSFFKNPTITKEAYTAVLQEYPDIPGYIQPDGTVKVSLGYILDKVCGLRGYCENSVCLYEKQALVLVAKRGMTAQEIKYFSEKIKKIVFEKTKINIECEVLFV